LTAIKFSRALTGLVVLCNIIPLAQFIFLAQILQPAGRIVSPEVRVAIPAIHRWHQTTMDCLEIGAVFLIGPSGCGLRFSGSALHPNNKRWSADVRSRIVANGGV
jgi:hypothetical protein